MKLSVVGVARNDDSKRNALAKLLLILLKKLHV